MLSQTKGSLNEPEVEAGISTKKELFMERLSNRILKAFVGIRESEQAQGFVEYIMIIGLVGIALTAALGLFRNQISSALNTVGTGV